MAGLSPKILVIDDEPAVRLVFEEALASADMSPVCLETAEAGLGRLEAERFDVLITDKNLPGMSGVELVRKIRPTRPNMRIFLITGYASDESALETLNLGIDGYIRKPFDDIFEVVARVRASLSSASDDGATGGATGHFQRALNYLREASTTLSGLRIVIANPSRTEVDRLRDYLKGSNDEISDVASADGLVATLEREPADLLVIDAELPGPGVTPLVERVAELAPRAVVVVTALRTSMSETIELIDANVRAVVQKPMDRQVLRERFEPVLSAMRQSRGARRERKL